MHGINLGGWFSQCEHTSEHYDTFICRDDIRRISEWGFDHLRLPVDYDLVEDAEGSYFPDGFDRIQQVIDWCGEYGLNMVLDLHKTYGFSFDDSEEESGFFENAAYQERFLTVSLSSFSMRLQTRSTAISGMRSQLNAYAASGKSQVI